MASTRFIQAILGQIIRKTRLSMMEHQDLGENIADGAGHAYSMGDVDGDGLIDLPISAHLHDENG